MPQRPYKLAVFAAHPIQYHVGIYRALAQLDGIEITVFYEDRIGLEPVYVAEFNTTIKWDIDLLGGYPSEFLPNWSRNPQGRFFARINPSILRTLRRGRFDAVLFNGYNRFSDWLVYLGARLSGTPLIFRGEATLRPQRSGRSWRARLKRWFLPRFFRRCRVVMYSCTGNRQYFKQFGIPDEKMLLIPCAVDNAFFQSERDRLADERGAIRESLGIGQDDFVVVLAAQMTPRKHPADLIEAIARVDGGGRSEVGGRRSELRDRLPHSGESTPRIVALFIGNGPLREDLEQLARDCGVEAVFTGFVNQSEISRYYAVGDLFAMLSEYDASPKALNEALNFGMPALCTKVTGTAYDLVKDGVNGYHIDAGDVDTIAEKIAFLAANRDVARQMGQESLAIVNEWSFEADAEAVFQAVEMAAGAAGKLGR